ncbi:MAG: hypothetical protein RMK29_01465 [Myxococcales bacterium]|nr:hypothetical protein [Myxococcota bacterium]MDW8280347.1 hypothetical protein [Myxococcales bacterium]
MRNWDDWLRVGSLLLLCVHGNSCNGHGVEYSYDLAQPINFAMTDSLHDALDVEGRRLFRRAALHAAEALGAQGGWSGDRSQGAAERPSHNMTVQLTLGDVDCTGDRAGYVRWRPNNVLQICPSMLRERSFVHIVSLVMHEMGHVLGASHVACDGESIMAPDLNCPVRKYSRAARDPERLLWYSDADIEEICRHTSGGICDRPPHAEITPSDSTIESPVLHAR